MWTPVKNTSVRQVKWKLAGFAGAELGQNIMGSSELFFSTYSSVWGTGDPASPWGAAWVGLEARAPRCVDVGGGRVQTIEATKLWVVFGPF